MPNRVIVQTGVEGERKPIKGRVVNQVWRERARGLYARVISVVAVSYVWKNGSFRVEIPCRESFLLPDPTTQTSQECYHKRKRETEEVGQAETATREPGESKHWWWKHYLRYRRRLRVEVTFSYLLEFHTHNGSRGPVRRQGSPWVVRQSRRVRKGESRTARDRCRDEDLGSGSRLRIIGGFRISCLPRRR